MGNETVEVFFYPESVALIGASGRPGAFSHEMLRNLTRSFKGRVYAVNPKYKEILGVRSYPSILDIPDEVDLAVIAVRADRTIEAVREAGEKGVKGAIIVAGGFAETGVEGARLQKQLVETARKYGVRIVGPNCIGVYNTVNGLDTFFLPPEKMKRPPRGYIAVVSQSGAFLTTMMDWLANEGVGIVKAINIGNKADVDEADVIDYYASQEYVRTIMVYIEGVSPGRGRSLVEAIRKARDDGKTIVILKGGRTTTGSRAAKSHTAALAGDYNVFKAAIREAGAVEAGNATEFVDWAKALAYMSHLKAEGRVLVLTNAGGPGVNATDALALKGLNIPPIPEDVKRRLAEKLPPIVALSNPIDLTGQATDDDYKLVLESLEGEDFFDSVLVLAPVQPATMSIRVADVIADWIWKNKKPGVAMTIGSDYGDLVKDYLDSRGIPTYTMPDRAASSLYAIIEASKPLCPLGGGLEAQPVVEEILMKAMREGRSKLLEHEALAVLEAYGVPVANYCLATSREEVQYCTAGLDEPLVAKIVSPDIIHKSDVGGVILNVKGGDEALNAYDEIINNVKSRVPQARITGVLYQEMAGKGVEVFIGAKRDPSFGPIVLFGLGGIFVEAIKDVSISLAPTNECRARRMIKALKSRRILEGYRNLPPRDIDSIINAIIRVSSIIANHPAIQEIDVNPLIAYEKGVIAVDARIIIKKT